ncbi:hypothetical protein RB195_023891 [Necator americanus]|uniref:Phlebovirus glycoprotein G2 fusion domain-containing protein n=1 Tax=Necator americanus TaxID=51031 RepID=A0ABR1EKZ7_NECAM
MDSKYLGYIACEETCGGTVCGCLLPMPVCSFLRLAQVPSKLVFEIVLYMEWTPTVQVDIEITMYNRGKEKSIILTPYVTHKYDELSITAVSIQKPNFPLMDRRFAVSENDALMLPNDFSLPVECESYIQAKEEFSKCKNRMVCTCENLKPPRGCKCPLGSIRNLRKEITNVLPSGTPFTEIRLEEGNINAYTHQHETNIVIESSPMFNSAHYIIEQSCGITFEEIKGCYNCLEGAQVKVSCITRINAWANFKCSSSNVGHRTKLI